MKISSFLSLAECASSGHRYNKVGESVLSGRITASAAAKAGSVAGSKSAIISGVRPASIVVASAHEGS